MNKISERSQNNPIIPLTPNLQQYKLHGKTKTKKKNLCPSIQPTLQPIHYQQKNPTTPTGANSKLTICQNHPDKKAMYTTKDNNKKQFCGICAVTDGGGDSKFLDQQKYEKTKSIQMFKKRVNTLKQNINTRQKQMQIILRNQQNQYGQYFSYLRTSFQNLIQSIQQKHAQLNNTLIQNIQKRKQTLNSTTQLMKDIKQSIQRYIFDINKNYQEILAQLSIDNFRDIMKQYNTKIQYYTENVFKRITKDQNQGINVYLPIHQIRRVIDKANIQYFSYQADRMGSTRSLEKFMSCGSGKDYKVIKNQKQQRFQRYQKNDRKSQSKIQQKRRTGQNMVHPIRGANKQNNYSDLYYNCQGNDQRGYNFD